MSNGKKGQARAHKAYDEIAKAVLVGKYLLCKVSLVSWDT